MDVDADPLPVAQLAGGGDRRRGQPDIEKRQHRVERIQFAEITESIANFGDIAVGPITHRNTFPVIAISVVSTLSARRSLARLADRPKKSHKVAVALSV